MPDSKQRIPRIQSDDDRARQPRARTNPQGFPIHVDPELTPPPQMPPIAPGDDIREQLRLLAIGLGQNTEAIGKVWGERGNAERIDKIDAGIAGLNASVSAWANESVRHGEAIKHLSISVGAVVAYTDSLRTTTAATNAQLETFFEREWPRHQQLLERVEKALDTVAERLTRLENAVDRLHSSDQALAARMTANEASTSALDVRVAALERNGREAVVRVDERKKVLTWGKAALFGAGGALMAIAEQLGLLG